MRKLRLGEAFPGMTVWTESYVPGKYSAYRTKKVTTKTVTIYLPGAGRTGAKFAGKTYQYRWDGKGYKRRGEYLYTKTPKRNPSKKMTYAQAETKILNALEAAGWTVKRHLVVPHATEPYGDRRLWFKGQAIWGGRGTSIKQARSLHLDNSCFAFRADNCLS